MLFLQEMEVISCVRETLTRAMENAKEQLISNKEMKHQLEKDWSDKVSRERERASY